MFAGPERKARRWAFTLSNAGSRFFEDRCDLAHLDQIDWNAVQAQDWRTCKEGKQAEFLLEHGFPPSLVERVGVHSRATYTTAVNALSAGSERPKIEIISDWCY